MSNETKQHQEYISSMFLKLSRGGNVTADEANMAFSYYNSFLMEFEQYKLVSDLDRSMSVGKVDMQNLHNSEDCRFRHEELKKQYEDLQNDHKLLGKELDYYRSKENEMKEESQSVDNTRKNDTNEADKADAALRSELERLRIDNDEKDKQLQCFRNRERQGGKPLSENRGQDHGRSKLVEKLKEQNTLLTEDKGKLTEQINELRNRLSILAGQKLTAGNPDIADLSDAYRPTNIAEKFRQLYDDEWTHAFEELEQNVTQNEEEQVDILATIIKDVDGFCSTTQQEQLEQLEHHAKRLILEPLYRTDKEREIVDVMNKTQEDLTGKQLRDFRKSLGILSTSSLKKEFHKAHMSPLMWRNKTIPSSKSLNEFVGKTLELIWIMKIQDPTMEFSWCGSGDVFNRNLYTHYTRRGDIVSQCVWPAVLLHKNGPLMSKGVVQGK